jgi:hypothetical protein
MTNKKSKRKSAFFLSGIFTTILLYGIIACLKKYAVLIAMRGTKKERRGDGLARVPESVCTKQVFF